MIFNKHFALAGQHARLSASKYHWIGYDEDKMAKAFFQAEAARRGTEMHALAHDLIRLGVKLPQSNRTLNMYVNDAISYRMTPEQLLFVSPNCFGTPDAISFREPEDKKPILRISDLKTGETPTSEKQLLVYAAMFCLEYKYDPLEIETELRIYQLDECRIYDADGSDIKYIMAKIVSFDALIESLREEAL